MFKSTSLSTYWMNNVPEHWLDYGKTSTNLSSFVINLDVFSSKVHVCKTDRWTNQIHCLVMFLEFSNWQFIVVHWSKASFKVKKTMNYYNNRVPCKLSFSSRKQKWDWQFEMIFLLCMSSSKAAKTATQSLISWQGKMRKTAAIIISRKEVHT